MALNSGKWQTLPTRSLQLLTRLHPPPYGYSAAQAVAAHLAHMVFQTGLIRQVEWQLLLPFFAAQHRAGRVEAEEVEHPRRQAAAGMAHERAPLQGRPPLLQLHG